MPIRRGKWYAIENRGYITSCWIWLGGKAMGYGVCQDPAYEPSSTKMTQAHRVYWSNRNGPIPKGMVLHHLCSVRACVNPDHLELTTYSENNKKAWIERKKERNYLEMTLAQKKRCDYLWELWLLGLIDQDTWPPEEAEAGE